jgi:nucleotide-binding universal stress UspA family protein
LQKLKEVNMFKHILLPTDGAELSAATIRQGIRFAKSIGAKVTGLSVMPLQHTVFYHEKISKEALEEVAQRFKEQAETYLAAIEKGAKEAGVACDIVYERNDSPYDSIIRVAEQKGCDLIMMASHGRKGVEACCSAAKLKKY